MTTEERAAAVNRAVHSFMRADRFHQIAIEAQVNRFGIHRTQHIILVYLMRHPEPPTQAEIAKAFEISPAAVAVTLKKLESAGLIERKPCVDNSRANHIRITDAGREIVEQTHGRFVAVDTAMFDGVSDEEVELLEGILARMQENLRNFEPEIENSCDCRENRAQQNRKAEETEKK